MKMRVLVSSSKGKMETLGNTICEMQSCTLDKIPPAYPCEKERLLILGASTGKEPSNALLLFCKELTPQRAQNVAFFIDGPEEGAKALIEQTKAAGTNVIEDVFYCKGGLPFKFAKGISPEEKTTIQEWTTKVLANLK